MATKWFWPVTGKQTLEERKQRRLKRPNQASYLDHSVTSPFLLPLAAPCTKQLLLALNSLLSDSHGRLLCPARPTSPSGLCGWLWPSRLDREPAGSGFRAHSGMFYLCRLWKQLGPWKTVRSCLLWSTDAERNWTWLLNVGRPASTVLGHVWTDLNEIFNG